VDQERVTINLGRGREEPKIEQNRQRISALVIDTLAFLEQPSNFAENMLLVRLLAVTKGKVSVSWRVLTA
jgi:hypothetical protein